MEINKDRGQVMFLVALSFVGAILLIHFTLVSAAIPQGPDELDNSANWTKGNVSAKMFNVSGGNIAVFNLNATLQNNRWKGFVGNVTGKFTLDDAGGASLYDWSISTISGRVYSTRNSTTVSWSVINCSNSTSLTAEDIAMNHSNVDDNITKTFNASHDDTNFSLGYGTHAGFYVGSRFMSDNTCPTINVFRNNASDDSYWEEMALYDQTNIVYAVIIDDDETGFNGFTYDFQMIVPENGLASFKGATAYYMYVELGT